MSREGFVCEFCGVVDADENEPCPERNLRARHRLVANLKPRTDLGTTRRATAPLGKGDRSGFTPASKPQRAAVKDQGCLLCGEGPAQPAHLIDRQMLADGQEHELAVIPLCALHHRGYDDGTLSVLEALEPYHRDILAYAVQRFGLISTLERVTNSRWTAREDRAA